MRLKDLIRIDSRFEKSVNLLLDLNVQAKLDGYIPTRSSVKILGGYIDEIMHFSGNRASVLIGPYGKGKSHLLLVMLAMLANNKDVSTDALLARIDSVSPEVADSLRVVKNSIGPMLPVIINAGNGSLNQAFMRSLTQALNRNGLQDVVPDNYYSEAVKMIHRWKTSFHDTYNAFCKELGSIDADEFIKALNLYDEKALVLFKKLYPGLTSGGTFNPIVDDEIISVYQSVNRILRTRYNYGGIYIIFDEFSKYIEGHQMDGFAEDMKSLQDMCELCNASRDEQLHLTCVAHKSIKSYGSSLSKEVLNAFKGVEGRLKEIFFIVSSQNSYELLSDAIGKTPKFDAWASNNAYYKELLDETFTIKAFSSLFTQKDYEAIVGKGCFPLTPIAAMLLLSLNEKIAQNERTLFTYITSRDSGGLALYIEKSRSTEFVGVDSIYDYFVPLFKEESQSDIHYEWLKADYALSMTDDYEESLIIKAIAVIRMVNKLDEINASDKFIRLVSGLRRLTCERAIQRLVDAKLIELKKRTGAYEFKNNVGVDVELALSDCINKHFAKVDIGSVIIEVAKEKYALPKKHNQEFYMTRYFNYAFMEEVQFLAMKSTSYLEWRNRPDGIVIFLLPNETMNKISIKEHAKSIGDSCLAVCLPNVIQDCTDRIQTMLAARYLYNSPAFLDGNDVLKTELANIEKDCISEINKWISDTYFPLGDVFGVEGRIAIGPFGLNRLVSDICDAAYPNTPIINQELINRHELSSQIAKARNIILEDLQSGQNCEKYKTGTSAESTIYRAVMLHSQDKGGLTLVRQEIEAFIRSCVGEKQPFEMLIDRLTKSPYGMRIGVLPIYILDCLLHQDDMPIIYFGNKEVVLDVETITNLVKKPKGYNLFIETETAQKREYIIGIEDTFSDFSGYCRETDKQNRLSRISCIMQSWYRSLPQTSMTFLEPDYDGQDMKQLVGFRKVFADLYLNPRDVLFDYIPQIFDSESLDSILNSIRKARKDIDAHIHVVKSSAAGIIREVFEVPLGSDLCQSLKEWYDHLPDMAKKSIFTVRTENIMSQLKDITSTDEEEIASKIVRAATGVFIEDWKPGMGREFQDMLRAAIDEVFSKQDAKVESAQKILIVPENGKPLERFYNFDPEELSPTANFFKNALDDIMEEYDSILESNEKIGILMDMVKKLMT